MLRLAEPGKGKKRKGRKRKRGKKKRVTAERLNSSVGGAAVTHRAVPHGKKTRGGREVETPSERIPRQRPGLRTRCFLTLMLSDG